MRKKRNNKLFDLKARHSTKASSPHPNPWSAVLGDYGSLRGSAETGTQVPRSSRRRAPGGRAEYRFEGRVGDWNLSPRELGESHEGQDKAVARGSPKQTSFPPCGAQGYLAGWCHFLRAAPQGSNRNCVQGSTWSQDCSCRHSALLAYPHPLLLRLMGSPRVSAL